MADARRILVIHNPAAGRQRSAFVGAVVAALRREGADVSVRETFARGDAERIARTANPDTHVVVAAGGDGTINEVINGLDARAYHVPPPALGVIPLGTVNLLARELALPDEAVSLARLLAHGRTAPVYSGIANGRRFALVAGAGFDAHVVRRVDTRLKRVIGRIAYAFAIIQELIAHTPVRYRVSIDGGEPIEAASVVVAKGRFYAGPFVLASEASVRKPELHVCLFRDGGRWNALRYLAAVGLGRIARTEGFCVVTGASVTVEGPAGEPVQGDGDDLATLPLKIALAQRALPVITPSA